MAKRIETSLVDDLDPAQAAVETVRFALDGQGYEIDLSGVNADGFRDVLSRYVAAARKVSGGKGSARRSTGSGEDPAAVRAWAREHGIFVSPRGRISSGVVQQFKAAQAA